MEGNLSIATKLSGKNKLYRRTAPSAVDFIYSKHTEAFIEGKKASYRKYR